MAVAFLCALGVAMDAPDWSGMSEAAGWIAPIATMIAAMMTAANLGARVTGWGFVVFLLGAVAWCVVAITTTQSNLLWSNAFLATIDVVGIWRWLGRQATLDDGAARARRASAKPGVPDLFPLTLLEGAEIRDRNGGVVGHSVGAMAESRGGRLSYVVVRERSNTEAAARHVALSWDWLEVADGRLRLAAGSGDPSRLDEIDPGAWPASAPAT